MSTLNSRFSPSQRAYWSAGLLWAGRHGFNQNGAKKAAKADSEGRPWSIVTGKELREGQPKAFGSAPKSAVYIVYGPASAAEELGKRPVPGPEIVAEKLSRFKSNLKAFFKANGWEQYLERSSKAASILILAGTTVAATALAFSGMVPLAAATVAAGSALASSVASGENTANAVKAAVDSGQMDALAAAAVSAGADPALVDALSSAAETLAGQNPAGSPPDQADQPAADEAEPIPAGGFFQDLLGRYESLPDGSKALVKGAAAIAAGFGLRRFGVL